MALIDATNCYHNAARPLKELNKRLAGSRFEMLTTRPDPNITGEPCGKKHKNQSTEFF